MKTKFLSLVGGLALLVVAPLAVVSAWGGHAGQKPPEKDQYRLEGPFTQGNLTVFLIHGKDKIKGQTFITLQEALVQKKVIVRETREVNELSIENISSEEVFVQSGDIVKGGQQDRMLVVDLILPPRSGRIPIAAFCVE
ncbi:MAG: ARPP-1 family domain-containing protein, partial [Acidobacteriota bacterium]